MRLTLISVVAAIILSSQGSLASPPTPAGPRPTPMIVTEPVARPHTIKPAAVKPKPRKPQLASRRGMIVRRITSIAHQMQGVPYVFGGTSSSGFDCSGFTYSMFARAGIRLNRMADEQYYQGKKVTTPERGDLVFFETYMAGPSHVGIYLGNDLFIHASSSRGVTVSSLKDSYWGPRYIGARRFF